MRCPFLRSTLLAKFVSLAALAVLGSMPVRAESPAPTGATIAPATERRTYIALEVFMPEGNEVIYTGGELIVESPDGTVTKKTFYQSPGKPPVQREEIVYRLPSINIVKYRYENDESGELVEMNSTDGSNLAIRHRESKDAKIVEKNYKWGSSSAFGKTLVRMMASNWKTLVTDKKMMKVQLLVPSRGESFAFKVELVRKLIKGHEGSTIVQMEPDSWLVRQFVPLMKFYFSGTPPQVYEFLGPSPVDSGKLKGKAMRVTFKFTDPPASMPI